MNFMQNLHSIPTEFKPFKLQHNCHKEQCVHCCPGSAELNSLLMDDDVHIDLTGALKRQNFHYWSIENSYTLHWQPLYRGKSLCGMLSHLLG